MFDLDQNAVNRNWVDIARTVKLPDGVKPFDYVPDEARKDGVVYLEQPAEDDSE